jgi:hypothetical protein
MTDTLFNIIIIVSLTGLSLFLAVAFISFIAALVDIWKERDK